MMMDNIKWYVYRFNISGCEDSENLPIYIIISDEGQKISEYLLYLFISAENLT